MNESSPLTLQETQEGPMKDLGVFTEEPKYPFLWDRCVYKLLYNPEAYTKELCDILLSLGVSKRSDILDTCAGSGFPAMDMYENGYERVTCVDGTDDQIEFFNQKAEDRKLDIRSTKMSWLELPEHFSPESFDALICKGSIWYAAGGWNVDFQPDGKETLRLLKQTLEIFHKLLRKGGVLFVDKFKDSEVSHKDVVGTLTVGTAKKELLFWTDRDREHRIRRAKMIIKDVATGEESGTPNVTFDLQEPEFEALASKVGFRIETPPFTEEKFFKTWFLVKE